MGQIGEILQLIEGLLPVWVLVPLLVIGAALLFPGWVTGVKIKRIKSLLRRATRADDDLRKRLLAEAWTVAEGKGEILIALAREADKVNQPALRDRATAALEAIGGYKAELRKLQAPKNPTEDKRFGHPVEAAVAIGRLLDNGVFEAARLRLDDAQAKFPHDVGLLALRARLEAGPPAELAAPDASAEG